MAAEYILRVERALGDAADALQHAYCTRHHGEGCLRCSAWQTAVSIIEGIPDD